MTAPETTPSPDVARLAELAGDRRLLGALRKIGHGKKRHPETQAFFDLLADTLPALCAEVEALRGTVERMRALAWPPEMGRAMWRASGLNEDLIELAKGPAAKAVQAALSPTGSPEPEVGEHDRAIPAPQVKKPSCNWTRCHRSPNPCFAWCKCRCHTRLTPPASSDPEVDRG